jgi:phosphatidylglycerol:prolipoprotein diacylglycerol transferase
MKDPWSIINLRQGGLSYHGAILGGMLALFIFARQRKLTTGLLLDICAIPALAGLAIGRIGCLMNGCCYGKIFQGPWAIMLPEIENPPLPRHPVQLYEAILCLIGIAVLSFWFKKKKFQGELFVGFVGIYAIIRFITEGFREGQLLALNLSLAQYASDALFAASLVWIIIGRAKAAPAQVMKETTKPEVSPER